jgi:hypothetical protein
MLVDLLYNENNAIYEHYCCEHVPNLRDDFNFIESLYIIKMNQGNPQENI